MAGGETQWEKKLSLYPLRTSGEGVHSAECESTLRWVWGARLPDLLKAKM